MNPRKKKKNSIAVIFLILAAIAGAPIFSVSAYEASSTNFELHAGTTEGIKGTSTSAAFKNTNSAGESVPGTSSIGNKKIFSSVINWLYNLFTVQYEQAHVRWRNNDGDEVAATWPVSEDATYLNFSKQTVKRLRFEISNEGWTRGTGQQFQIEFAQLTSGSDCAAGPFTTVYTAVPTDYSLHFHLATSTLVTDATATTNVASGLSDTGASFKAGEVKTTGNTTSAITVSSEQFTEIEYGLYATAGASVGSTYCFRVTNLGATTNYLYTNYAKATLSSGMPVSGDLISAVFDTTGSADGPAYNSIMWKGTAGTGKLRFQLATSPNATGPWNYYGGALCTSSDWYEATTQGAPVEITCANQYHNNDRYFKYKARVCSSDCSGSGATSPVVSDVIVNWSP